MCTAVKNSIKTNCSLTELSSWFFFFFFFGGVSEKARDTKEALNLLVAPPIRWCLKKIRGPSIQDSNLSSEKPFSLDYSKSIFLMFTLSWLPMDVHWPVQEGMTDNVPTEIWLHSRIGGFFLRTVWGKKDVEKWSSTGEAGLQWVKCCHITT